MLTRRMVSGRNMLTFQKKMFAFWEILFRVVDIYILFFVPFFFNVGLCITSE